MNAATAPALELVDRAIGMDWLDDDLDGGETFRLADLVTLHADRAESGHPDALDECLGDGALLRRIPELARLREGLRERGYRCVSSHELPDVQSVVPMLELMRIFETKTIPYRRTQVAARCIVDQVPAMRFDDLTLRDTFTPSYTFHEGAHALAYEMVREAEGTPTGARLVEVLVGGEAFAMALEAFAALRDPRRSTALLLSVNAYADPFGYMKHEGRNPGLLRRCRALAAREPGAMLRYLASSFLVANLRPTATAAQPSLARALCEQAGLASASESDAAALLAIGLDVCVSFRKRVAPTFFRWLGLEGAYRELVATPLERSFAAGSLFHDHRAGWIEAVTVGR